MVNFMDFYYTGPGTLAGRYMRKFWHPVLRAEDLQPGWAKPLKIMSEQFTLYRGESGKPHVVDFRCAHRQTQLSVGWVEDDCIRCRFHGWKYDGSGQCIEQPAEKESFAEKIRIRSCPTQEYLGLIFVYFGEGAPPPLPRYPDFEKDTLWAETYIRPCNYVNNLENDPIHIPFTHRESEFYMNRPPEIPDIEVEESEWGVLLQSHFPSGRHYITQVRALDASMVHQCKYIAGHRLAVVLGGVVRLGAFAMAAIVERKAAKPLGCDGIVPAHALPVFIAVGGEAVHQHDCLAAIGGTEFIIGEVEPIGREVSHDFP